MGGKCLIWHTTHRSHFVTKGSQGRNPRRTWRQELKQRGHEETRLPHGLSPVACLNLLSYATQGWHHPLWVRPIQVNHQLRKCTTDLPTGQSSGQIFSTEVPSSRMMLARATLSSSQHRPHSPPVHFQRNPQIGLLTVDSKAIQLLSFPVT